MKVKVIISLFIIATSISACGRSNTNLRNITNPNDVTIETENNITNPNDVTIETENNVTYQDILDEYEQKLKSKTLNIVEEYNAEYEKVSDSANNMLELAESKWNKILAINAEGVDKMNELMRKNGDVLSTCQEWADKLNNCCKEQQKILLTAYKDSLIVAGINAETLEKEIQPEEFKGRGISDSGRSEPEYIGITGYVVVGYSQEKSLRETDKLTKTPWLIPSVSTNGKMFKHKTKVIVESQELKHEGWGTYSGFLTVKNAKTGKKNIVNVNNFITKPYWKYDNLTEAAKVGYYIAEYHQASSNYPITRQKELVKLETGMKILVIGPTDLYGRDGPDRNIYSIEAIVFKEWSNGYGGVSVFFNPQDLKIVY